MANNDEDYSMQCACCRGMVSTCLDCDSCCRLVCEDCIGMDWVCDLCKADRGNGVGSDDGKQ